MKLWALILGLLGCLTGYIGVSEAQTPRDPPVSPPDPSLLRGIYRSPWPYYEYDLSWAPVAPQVDVAEANELELRTMLCQYDPWCYKRFPISDEEWEIVSLRWQANGLKATRALVR